MGWRLAVLGAFLACAACGGTVASGDGGGGGVCLAAAEPTVLATLESPSGLLVVGGSIYSGFWRSSATGDVHAGLDRRPRNGGPPTHVVTSGYLGGPFHVDQVDVFFPHGVMEAGRMRFPEVLAQPLAGGPARALPMPPGAKRVAALRSNGGRGVFFLAIGDSSSWIARWDGEAMSVVPTEQPLRDAGDRFLADDTRVYWMSSTGELMATPLDGGPASSLGAHRVLSFLGQDDAYLYAAWDTTFRIPKAGGPATTVIRARDFEAVLVDGGWLYFVAEDDRATIQRVRTSGGEPEVFAREASAAARVWSLAADECAIYWCATDTLQLGNGPPARLLRKAK